MNSKGLKGTNVLNRAWPFLHEGSLENMLTVPLKILYEHQTIEKIKICLYTIHFYLQREITYMIFILQLKEMAIN